MKTRNNNTTADEEIANAWQQFLNDIGHARKELGCDIGSEHEAWFRGHSRGSHSLLPSLFRHFRDPNDPLTWDKVWQKEADLFWEFSARARELHGGTESDWDILFAMQHHGTPTRLLDWTEVLAVAVYFAVANVDESSQGDHPCVWVLNPYRLNECSEWGDDLVYPPYLGWDEKRKTYYSYGELLVEDGMDWDWPVAIYPRQRTTRIHAQRGWFTIHGDRFLPIDGFRDRKRYLRKVQLPLVALPAARIFLEFAGVNHYSLFPDLQNLSLHLREKHELAAHARSK